MVQIVIEKWGNSPVVRIPESVIEKVGFNIGYAIDI